MKQSIQTLTKNEFCKLLIDEIASKLSQFETDLWEQSSSMSENNRSFYVKGQNELIRHWREFLKFAQANKSHISQKVEDGALVKIEAHDFSRWLYIYKIKSELQILGETVEINDGALSRLQGSIKDSRIGDIRKLIGDGRGISDIEVKIVQVL